MLVGKRIAPSIALRIACLAPYLLARAYVLSTHGTWVEEATHVPQTKAFLHGP